MNVDEFKRLLPGVRLTDSIGDHLYIEEVRHAEQQTTVRRRADPDTYLHFIEWQDTGCINKLRTGWSPHLPGHAPVRKLRPGKGQSHG